MWAKYCEIIDNNLCAEHVHPLGQPDDGSAGHHDLLHLLVAGIQEILRTEKWVSRCQSFLHLYSTTLLCTHNGFWKHHILFLPKMHKSLYAMWGRMHRTWTKSLKERGWHFSVWVKAPFFTVISWDKASKSRFCGTPQFKLSLSPLKWALSASFTF